MPAFVSRRLVLAAVTTALAASLIPATAADAASHHHKHKHHATPARPAGVHVTGLSSHTVEVSLPKVRHAHRYRVWASSVRSRVYVATIRGGHSAAARSSVRTSPRVTAAGLRYSTAPVYYRVEVSNGPKRVFDPTIRLTYLRPAVPSTLHASSGPHGTSLTWHGVSAARYSIEQASDGSMAHLVHYYSVPAGRTQFTPYDLVKGRPAYFRIRAVNGTTPSSWSPVVRVVPLASEQSVSVMSYNVLEGSSAGQREGDGKLATWAQRRSGVVALIRAQAPDILAVQEAAAWVGSPQGYGGTRQVDDLRRALGGSYALAYTEAPPTQHGYVRKASYVLYRTDRWQAVGTGGAWNLGHDSSGHVYYAAYQLLRNRASGARTLAVSAHLVPYARQPWDSMRQIEMESLIRQASAVAKADGGAPVLYAGDFNSAVNRNHVFDGPGRATSAVGLIDAAHVAQTRTNGRYNSANQNYRTPPAFGQYIDHVYVPAGVGVRSWAVVLPHLVNGRFPGVIPSDHNAVVARLALPY